MKNRKNVYLIGYASAIAGPDPMAGEGPLVLQKSPHMAALSQLEIHLHWQAMIGSEEMYAAKLAALAAENVKHLDKNTLKSAGQDEKNKTGADQASKVLTRMAAKLASISADNQLLAREVAGLVTDNKFFIVLGGDHTSAIGTWSGVAYALGEQHSLGLIWIDAHMDSHTPQTSLTGNYHGMPLACLLGLGECGLTGIMRPMPKVKPEHLCLIGVRSFEEEEEILLRRLKVRIYYMEEIEKRGLDVVMEEALKIVTKGTAGFGVSLDIDSIDPLDAPATDVSVPGGIRAQALCESLRRVAAEPGLLGAEIVEFDPHRDVEQKTEKLVAALVKVMLGF